MVWNAALPRARVIEICKKETNVTHEQWIANAPPPIGEPDYNDRTKYRAWELDKDNLRNWELQRGSLRMDIYLFQIICPAPGNVPTVAATCHEARQVVQNSFQLSLSTMATHGQTWFSHDFDVLYIDVNTYSQEPDIELYTLWMALPYLGTQAERHAIKQLAIRVDREAASKGPEHYDDYKLAIINILGGFGGVETLTIVLEHDYETLDPGAEKTLIALIDIGAVLAIGKSGVVDMVSDEHKSSSIFDVTWAEVDVEEMVEGRDEMVKDGEIFHWEMPKIEYKIAVETRVAERLAKLIKFMRKRPGAESVFIGM
jgi:hypothetical protein